MFKKCCDHKDPFVRLLVFGFAGAIAGLLGGFVLGFAIWGLQLLVCELDSGSHCSGMLNIATFLGSGAGTFVGALLGGILAFKKK